jgi:hypothetical protein
MGFTRVGGAKLALRAISLLRYGRRTAAPFVRVRRPRGDRQVAGPNRFQTAALPRIASALADATHAAGLDESRAWRAAKQALPLRLT